MHEEGPLGILEPEPPKDDRSWLERHGRKVIGGLLLVLSVLAGVIAYGMWFKKSEDPVPNPAPVVQDSTPADTALEPRMGIRDEDR